MLIDGQPVFEEKRKVDSFSLVLAFYNLPLSRRREILVDELKVLTLREYRSRSSDVEAGRLAFPRIKRQNLVDKLSELVFNGVTKQ